MATNEGPDDLFDITDDDQDELKYTMKELNRYFEEGHLQSMMEEEDLIDEDSSDVQMEEEEEVLSQHFSQLSTNNDEMEEEPSVNMKKRPLGNVSHPDSTVVKKVKLTEDHDMDEPECLPAYLRPTNGAFRRLVEKVTEAASSIDVESLRRIAILKHQIAALQINKQISLVYLRSGKGELREPEPEITPVDRRVWPTQVKSAMSLTREEDEHVAYEHLVHQRVRQTDEQIQRYQRQVNEAKQSVFGLTASMDEAMDAFVEEHGIRPLRMKRDLKIALLEHEFDAEILERRYAQENPNDYQVQVAKRLYESHYEVEKLKREIVELELRVFYQKASVSFDEAQLVKIEAKYSQCYQVFETQWKAMWENHRNLVSNKGMPTVLHKLIERRFKNITDKLRDIHNYRVNYYLRNSFDDVKPAVRFSTATLIMDTPYRFNDRQQRLLNRGPTYVPPCQLHISSSIDEIVKKQYVPLQHRLACFFSKYHVNIALSMEIEKQTREQFHDLFSVTIPAALRQRAIQENELVQSIRRCLKKHNLVLRRTADRLNTFYVGDASAFESKADHYLNTTDAYKLLLTLDEDNDKQQFWREFNEMVHSINSSLDLLKRRKALDQATVNRLRPDPTKVQLPYLYFLPDVSNAGEVSLMPMIPSRSSVTWKIGQYINRLLRPLVTRVFLSRSFLDEADFIQKLNSYASTQHRLRATTLFCTLRITNFHTLATHKNLLEAVGYFLQDNLATPRLEGLSTATIQNLLQLFLYNNMFCYKNKIYTIAKGGPNTVPLSDTLSNIYLFEWQKIIGQEVDRSEGFFGRHRDQLFFTWNGSNQTLRTHLQSITTKHPNVHVQTSSGTSVQFMDVYIENRNGELFTRVHQELTKQRYTLPYVSGHPKWNYANWFRAALIRAVCCCSSIDDFQQERIRLELTFLASGYSLVFVETHVQHFFSYFHAETMRFSSDQTRYISFRRRLFGFLDQQRQRSDQLQKFDNQGQLIRFEYLYDVGPRSHFNERFQQLWSKYLTEHPTLFNEPVKIVLTTKQRHSLNALLTRPKSLCWIQK